MLYTTFTVNDKDYKCRLTTKGLVELEKKLGTNPLNILMEMGNKQNLPSIGTLLMILHASLQAYEHGISMDNVYDIYDRYVEEGHTMIDLIEVINNILLDSGIIPKVGEDEAPIKNYKVVENK